ncbi:MAG: hypothetical protein WAL47_05225 [Pyrinomonadaceae bacterium]
MSKLQTRVFMRWALSVGLAALGLLLTFSGFVTAIFATGRPADQIGLLWANQARFRLALGATLWLASLVVFMSLRSGSAGTVFKNREIGSVKRWLYLIVLAFLLLISGYSWLDLLKHS